MSATHGRPRASILVTNHDYEDFVGDAVESALAQQGGGVQVVVVDDGSTDGSLDVLSTFGDRIELVAQSNGGQGAAFNAAFVAATAPIVVFLDADDVIAPDLVDRLGDAFARDDVVRVQFPLAVIDRAGRPTGATVPGDPRRLVSGDVRDRLVAFPDDLTWQPTSGNAFRRSVLAEMMPMPTEGYRICADYYLSNLSAAHGTIAVLDDVGGGYRVHGDNAHYGSDATIASIRANVARTSLTHTHLIDHCRELGLGGLPDDPDRVRSVTALANRMLSWRDDASRHPIDGDGRWRLCREGVRASFGRFDVGIVRRGAMAAWFVVAAIAPRRAMRFVARPFVGMQP